VRLVISDLATTRKHGEGARFFCAAAPARRLVHIERCWRQAIAGTPLPVDFFIKLSRRARRICIV
jgi:hypothetical protein